MLIFRLRLIICSRVIRAWRSCSFAYTHGPGRPKIPFALRIVQIFKHFYKGNNTLKWIRVVLLVLKNLPSSFYFFGFYFLFYLICRLQKFSHSKFFHDWYFLFRSNSWSNNKLWQHVLNLKRKIYLNSVRFQLFSYHRSKLITSSLMYTSIPFRFRRNKISLWIKSSRVQFCTKKFN